MWQKFAKDGHTDTALAMQQQQIRSHWSQSWRSAYKQLCFSSCGCGTVGRMVVSNTRDTGSNPTNSKFFEEH